MTGITTINLGGEIRLLSFKNNFVFKLGIFLKVDPIEAPIKIEEICTQQSPMQAIVIIVYCAMCAYFEREGNYTHGLTIKQVAEWVDDADQNEFTAVWEMFTEIMGIPKASEEQIAEYEKTIKKKLVSYSKATNQKNLQKN